ncbi:hypothetical protein F4821DRAFT_252640 [Hypoxylon rubiginosum]|uniref:Uncharacterized protein n=1 Tax=Hypoxylon rubiginosum TaxID=110542 RepID=A0ACC0DM17_9PEZI|nr:hypothetical protein F4821DRAFT_252640 [Hypoxylon rubiginosum]
MSTPTADGTTPAGDGTATRPFIYNLPLDIVYQWTMLLYRDDPTCLVQLANGLPEIFFQQNFDLAKLDIYHQVRANTPAAPGLDPLLPIFFHNRYTKLPVIRHCLDLLVAESPDAINGIFPSGRTVMPFIHTAVRAGRSDVIQLILMRHGAQVRHNIVHQVLNSVHTCRDAGKPHIPPCVGALGNVFHHCDVASHAAITWYETQGNATVRNGIEESAILLINAGQHPTIHQGNGIVLMSIQRALRAGMINWARAVIHATLALPADNSERQRLLGHAALPTIFRQALQISYATDFLRYLTEQADDNPVALVHGDDNYLVLCLPARGNLVTDPANPLRLRNMPNALLVLRQMMFEAEKFEGGYQVLAEQLTGAGRVIKSATENALHDYFLTELEAIDLVTANITEIQEPLKTRVNRHVDDMFQMGLTSYGEGIVNVRYLIQNRNFWTTGCLAAAIDSRNIDALNEILPYWTSYPGQLRAAMQFPNFYVPDSVRTQASYLSPLARCVQLMWIPGIIRLLSQGIPLSDINPQYWAQFTLNLDLDYNRLRASQVTIRWFVFVYYGWVPRTMTEQQIAATIARDVPNLINVVNYQPL